MGNKKRALNYRPRKKKKYYGPKKEVSDVSDVDVSENTTQESASEDESDPRSSASLKKLSSSWWWNRDSNAESDQTDDSTEDSDDVFVEGCRGNCIADLGILKDILLKHAVCAVCKLINYC